MLKVGCSGAHKCLRALHAVDGGGPCARSVIANLWAADDRFSLSLMRAFYRELHGGADVAEALRRAKSTMIEQFGGDIGARLWNGMLAYGDANATVTSPAPTAQ